MEESHKPDKLTGLEYLQQRAAGTLPNPNIFATMGMTIAHVEKGLIKIFARPDQRHLNARGTAQGGFAASVLDAAVGLAVMSMMPTGLNVVTVGLNLHLLKPVLVGKEPLIAEGRIVHLSRRIGVADGTLTDAAGKRVAIASGSCMILSAT